MDKLKNAWKRIPAPIRKPLVFMIGAAIIVAGLAMLVLPGPGWAAIFLGFAVLATEFAIAEKVRDWLVSQLKLVLNKARLTWDKLIHRDKHKHQ